MRVLCISRTAIITPEEWERNNWTLVATIPWSNSKSAQSQNVYPVLCVLERRLSGLRT
jgi:hypothetical protein